MRQCHLARCLIKCSGQRNFENEVPDPIEEEAIRREPINSIEYIGAGRWCKTPLYNSTLSEGVSFGREEFAYSPLSRPVGRVMRPTAAKPSGGVDSARLPSS